MKLLVIRHAIAEDPADFARTGQHDHLRPLTSKGRRRMRRAAAGLKRLVPELDHLASSPLVRARETAEILMPIYPAIELETVEELAPDQELPAFVRWARSRNGLERIAVVGHEPHLSHLVSWLLGGRLTSFITLKKGAAALLEFGEEPAPGEGTLRWLLQPGQLRLIRH